MRWVKNLLRPGVRVARHQIGQLALHPRVALPMREVLARRYLRGSGIEVGALHAPVPAVNAKVRYVDRMNTDDLRRQYPELNDMPLVPVDIIDDGERLTTIADESQDFVIANHFLEHCENPLMTLDNLLRVIVPGGILYLALPEQRRSDLDQGRAITPFAHLVADLEQGPEVSRRQHYQEWVDARPASLDAVQLHHNPDVLMEIGYSIHFHVWDVWAMLDMLSRARAYVRSDFDIEVMQQDSIEVIFIIRKYEAAPSPQTARR